MAMLNNQMVISNKSFFSNDAENPSSETFTDTWGKNDTPTVKTMEMHCPEPNNN